MRKIASFAFLFTVLAALPRTVTAEPVAITSGYIQVGVNVTDWTFTTASGLTYTGEREMSGTNPVLFSGMPGDLVNLSSIYENVTTSITLPESSTVRHLGRAEFTFTAGNGTIPGVGDVLAGPPGALAFAPFTFTGSILLFASVQDQMANVNPIERRDFFGSGTAEARFRVQTTNTGVLLPEAPLNSFSVVYRFEPQDQAPVPEPGTLLLLGSGLAAALTRARRRVR